VAARGKQVFVGSQGPEQRRALTADERVDVDALIAARLEIDQEREGKVTNGWKRKNLLLPAVKNRPGRNPFNKAGAGSAGHAGRRAREEEPGPWQATSPRHRAPGGIA
jgi:hypothetical protein